MSNTDLGSYLFHQGTNYRAYEYLGCSLLMKDGKYEYTFRTWAPNAKAVGLVSDFSGWNRAVPFSRVTEKGIWELKYLSDVSLELQPYKFRIKSRKGNQDKGDPYARFSRGGADGASLIFTSDSFKWEDKRWMTHRKKTITSDGKYYIPAPLNIYEMHMGSFMRHEEDNRYYSYRELADILPSYLKKMGYTHVEFLPLQEHPFDGSWGYQVCAFYAPTSRFGTPDDLRHLINSLHKAGIGVIMDWVPAHFPKDAWGLYEFDGKPLYEYQGKDRMESRSWGTRFFDLGREEIQSFLVSNALYFFREFHIDGLRVDAVASMIYLDYDRMPGEWHPNHLGTNENLEATAFLRKLNTAIYSEFPDALMIAEESTSFGGITKPVSDGGIGFNLKWNMGWANDFYAYVQTDPIYRKYHHKALNFPLMYAFTEQYVMPISHDEVVHGKLSFINKMHGSLEDKFKQARTSLMLMMTYPGKKMLFMGTEYAQFREWDFDNSLEWFMLDYPNHKYFREYVASLNAFYLAHSELWDIDFNEDGFRWILADEADKNLVAFRRIDRKGRSLTVVLNFSGCDQEIVIPTERGIKLQSVFDTGDFSEEQRNVKIKKSGDSYSATIRVSAFSGIIYKNVKSNKKIKI
ncbi:MAG: 1,4-alpha-glucan branching protein GlgB [Clostridia bacterium]|nr:1,4-alpha-glucan branching protein GlgB [Clostridia bacterium]